MRVKNTIHQLIAELGEKVKKSKLSIDTAKSCTKNSGKRVKLTQQGRSDE